MGRREKKRRKVFNLYNFAVLLCLGIIIGALIFLCEQDSKMLPDGLKAKYADAKQYLSVKFDEWTSPKEENTNVNNENTNTQNYYTNKNNVNTNVNNQNSYMNNQNDNTPVNSTGDANEAAARLVAAQKFRELGENNVAENSLSVTKIQRQGEEYFYISSNENSLEIKISTGEITRINSIPVQ